jgi:hypothetical protein
MFQFSDLRMEMQVDFEPPVTNRLFIHERFYEVECGRVERCLSLISTPRLLIGQFFRQARGHFSRFESRFPWRRLLLAVQVFTCHGGGLISFSLSLITSWTML